MYFRCFVLISPLEKFVAHYFNKIKSPLSKNALCQVENGPVVLEMKMKSLQTDGRTDRQTDDRQQVIRKAHLSFQFT